MKALTSIRPHVSDTQHAEISAVGAEVRSLLRNGKSDEAAAALSPFYVVGTTLQAGELSPAELAELNVLAALVTGFAYIRGSREEFFGCLARAFIADAIDLNVSLGSPLGLGECFACLGELEFYQGNYDKAERLYGRALDLVKGGGEPDLLLTIYYRYALVYWRRGALRRAIGLLEEAAPHARLCREPAVAGNYHSTFALIYRKLGSPDEADYGYYDLSYLEYEAALYSYEQSGHTRYIASTINNLAYIQMKRSRFAEAHSLIGRARAIYVEFGEPVYVAQTDETRAQILIAEGRWGEALPIIERAVNDLDAVRAPFAFAEAVGTKGIVFARLGEYALARESFDQSLKISKESGDSFSEGRTILDYAEAFADRLTQEELSELCEEAVRLLAHTQHAEVGCKLKALRRRLPGISYERVLPFRNMRAASHRQSDGGESFSVIPARAKALGEFTLVIPDNTLTHIGYAQGTRMIFSADASPEPGDIVAVHCQGKVYVGIHTGGSHLETATGRKYPFTDFSVIGVA
jgi:tetratricopeptide (TPR) repeat protein